MVGDGATGASVSDPTITPSWREWPLSLRQGPDTPVPGTNNPTPLSLGTTASPGLMRIWRDRDDQMRTRRIPVPALYVASHTFAALQSWEELARGKMYVPPWAPQEMAVRFRATIPGVGGTIDGRVNAYVSVRMRLQWQSGEVVNSSTSTEETVILDCNSSSIPPYSCLSPTEGADGDFTNIGDWFDKQLVVRPPFGQTLTELVDVIVEGKKDTDDGDSIGVDFRAAVAYFVAEPQTGVT